MKITDETTVGELKALMGQKVYAIYKEKIVSGEVDQLSMEDDGLVYIHGGAASGVTDDVFLSKADLKAKFAAHLDEQKRKLEAGEFDEDE
jgi:hypothetical protein